MCLLVYLIGDSFRLVEHIVGEFYNVMNVTQQLNVVFNRSIIGFPSSTVLYHSDVLYCSLQVLLCVVNW